MLLKILHNLICIWSGAMIRKSYRVLKTIATIDGTLYEGDMVQFSE